MNKHCPTLHRWCFAGLLLLSSLTNGCTENQGSTGQKAFGPDSLTRANLFTDPDSSYESMEELDSNDRENWQKPQMVISRLGDLSDKVVADIGAGTGYFTMRLARKAQKVIAVDIEQQFLDYINRRLERTPSSEQLNVEARLTEPDDPQLADGEADLVFIVNTYAFIVNRVAYFSKVHRGIRDGGRLVVVDFQAEPLPVGPPTEDKVSWELVRAELDSSGFHDIIVDSTGLDYQYTVTAMK